MVVVVVGVTVVVEVVVVVVVFPHSLCPQTQLSALEVQLELDAA